MEKLQERRIYDVQAPNASTRIINSNVLNWDDVRFPWAYPLYKNMLGNFWTPFEINMSSDIKQYPSLSSGEQEAFNKIIGLLAFLMYFLVWLIKRNRMKSLSIGRRIKY